MNRAQNMFRTEHILGKPRNSPSLCGGSCRASTDDTAHWNRERRVCNPFASPAAKGWTRAAGRTWRAPTSENPTRTETTNRAQAVFRTEHILSRPTNFSRTRDGSWVEHSLPACLIGRLAGRYSKRGLRNVCLPLVPMPTVVPVGGSPTAAGESPAPPHFSEQTLRP